MKWAIFIGISIILLYFFFPRKIKKTNMLISGKAYQIEYAQTTIQKAKGLGGRNSLCSNCGMLFIFGNSGIHPFWMKDTKIPLDMIWLDKNGKIVHYVLAQPEPSVPLTQLKIYKNSIPAKYVLELNASDFTRLQLKIGDTIKIN